MTIGFSFALLASADSPEIPMSHVPGSLCAGTGSGAAGVEHVLCSTLITNALETGIVWDLCTMGAADQHATACIPSLRQSSRYLRRGVSATPVAVCGCGGQRLIIK